jgi:hypothetical protein
MLENLLETAKKQRLDAHLSDPIIFYFTRSAISSLGSLLT